MVRARASPYCLAVMALVACCLSTAPGQESKTWLGSLQHCQQQGRELATPSNGGFGPPKPGTFWVGALMSLTEWVWGRDDPLYSYKSCRRQAEGTHHDLGVANEAGACFHVCPGKRFVALKGAMCLCLDNEGSGVLDKPACQEMCYRNTNNTCGGQNSYSVYELNLLNKEPNQTIVMAWTYGHENAAIFQTPSDSLWRIVPTPSWKKWYMYCYRTDLNLLVYQITSTGYQKDTCKYTQLDVVFTSRSSVLLRIHGRQSIENHPLTGWIYLSRIHLPRWMDGNRTDGFPPVIETEPGPLCGTLTWNGETPVYKWKLCSVTLPFLCSSAPPSPITERPTQSEAGGMVTTYVAIAGAGGVVFLAAVFVSICLCRKRTGRMSSGSKTGKQMAVQQGHVSSAANVTGDRDGGNYDVMAPDGAVSTVYMNAQAGSSTKQIELVEDELEGNYACVDEPPKANALPVQKEAGSASSPSPAPAADEADSCMYAVVQKPTYQNAPARQEAEPEKATPPLDMQEVKPLEELYACVKK